MDENKTLQGNQPPEDAIEAALMTETRGGVLLGRAEVRSTLGIYKMLVPGWTNKAGVMLLPVRPFSVN